MRKLIALLAAAGVAIGVSACGEKEQVVVYKQGKYQGKPDGRPWDNDPVAWAGSSGGPKWTKGDRASWETQIKTRNDGQNENKRIGD